MGYKIPDLTELAWDAIADDDNLEIQDASAGSSGSKRIEILELQKAIRRTNTTIFNVMDFGAVGDGATDDTAAINAAINAWSDGDNGPTVYFPKAEYKITSEIQLKRQTHLLGVGSGRGDDWPLLMCYDCPGITVNSDVTLDGAVVAAGTSAAGSIIEGISFRHSGTPDSTSHGIWLRAKTTIRDCSFWGFYDNIKIVATEGSGLDATEGNAEGFSIENTLATTAFRYGVHMSGTHAGRGFLLNVDVSLSVTAGFKDDGTGLPNNYWACHCAYNGTEGSYNAGGSPAVAHLYVGCYEEGVSSGFGDVASPAMFLGGFMTGVGGTATYWGRGRMEECGIDFTSTEDADTALAVELGKNDRAISWHVEGDTAIGWGIKWANDNKGWWEFGHAGGGIAYILTTAITDTLGSGQTLDSASGGGTLPGGRMGFYDDPLVYKGSSVWGTLDMSTVLQKSSYTGTEAPTSGTWLRGDVVWNTAPTSGGTLGWICTTAGTPGTWKVMGGTIA
jgi:hypothetical protein